MSSAFWFQHLARNEAFSNHRLHTACAALSPEEYAAKRVSFFPSLKLTFEHLYLVQIYYMDALTESGRGRSVMHDVASFPTHPQLREAQVAADQDLVAFVDRLTDADLARKVSIERTAQVDVETIGMTLMHLFEHQIHHRGQAHAMVAGTNVPPPQLDEYFLDVDGPVADHELTAIGVPRTSREVR